VVALETHPRAASEQELPSGALVPGVCGAGCLQRAESLRTGTLLLPYPRL